MTTIATDGKSMAGDGLLNSNAEWVVAMDFKKVRLIGKDVVGVAGDARTCEKFFSAYEAGETTSFYSGAEYAAVALTKNGAFAYDGSYPVPVAVSLPFAIGNGAKFAMGAMDAGASPIEAVRIASTRCLLTGGDIYELPRAGR